jgi:CheY-like chemotaxis protein
MSQKKILIVDDSAIVSKTLSITLKANGYDVVVAQDGSEAVGVVRKQKPDLILLDIDLPPDVGHGGGIAWDGFLIIEWVRRSEELRHIPFIIVTGGDPAKLKDRAMTAGAVDFFTKPVNKFELLAAIGKVLGVQPDAEEPAA